MIAVREGPGTTTVDSGGRVSGAGGKKGSRRPPRRASIEKTRMRRREFIALVTLAAVGGPPIGRAQQSSKDQVRIGFLWGGVAEVMATRINSFLEGTRSVIRAEGLHVQLLSRTADGDPGRLPALAREIAAETVDVFFAAGPAAVQAATTAAPGVPTVAIDLETNPIKAGYVSSLARPGGNVTGIFFDFPDFATKWLELLREALPKLSSIAVLWDSSTGSMQLDAVQNAARQMSLDVHVIEVKDAASVGPALHDARHRGADGVLLLFSPLIGSNVGRISQLSLQERLPAITLFPEFAHAGGLMAYGPNLLDLFRQAGAMTGKVAIGMRPADLPVERPARFQLVINLKTARALQLSMSPSLLIRADEVIE
jgi:putative tryptophan/tyrosine transport system substrate-binding protein